MKTSVFFTTEGIALTSTSANHIANMAKEFVQDQETILANIRFYSTDMSLVGSSASNRLSDGCDYESLSLIGTMLDEVAQAKSLIAWLREGIKYKDKLYFDCKNVSLEAWAADNGVTIPERPECGHVLTSEEYFDSLSIKERNRYYELETLAAVYGKYIHPDGKFAVARKELKDISQNPNKVDGKGRDALIYSYHPSVDIDDVDKLFFELQNKHREVQAQLNSMKHACEQAIFASQNEVNTKFNCEIKEWEAEMLRINGEYKAFKDEKVQECSRLKIAIPNSLLGIYNKISQLGK